MALGPHTEDPNRREELKRKERDLKEGRREPWAALPDLPESLEIDASFYMKTRKTGGPIGGLEGQIERLALALFDRLGVFKSRDNNKVVYPVVRELLGRAGGDEAKALALFDSPATAERLNFYRGLVSH